MSKDNLTVLHNTRELLENYVMMKYLYITRTGKLSYEQRLLAKTSGCTVNELIYEAEKLDMEVFDGENSMKEKIRWLDLTIRYLHANLLLLKSYPQKGELYCKLLKLRYLQNNPLRPIEISELMHISRHTYQRRMHEAVDELGILLWGDLDQKLENRFINSIRTYNK